MARLPPKPRRARAHDPGLAREKFFERERLQVAAVKGAILGVVLVCALWALMRVF